MWPAQGRRAWTGFRMDARLAICAYRNFLVSWSTWTTPCNYKPTECLVSHCPCTCPTSGVQAEEAGWPLQIVDNKVCLSALLTPGNTPACMHVGQVRQRSSTHKGLVVTLPASTQCAAWWREHAQRAHNAVPKARTWATWEPCASKESNKGPTAGQHKNA